MLSKYFINRVLPDKSQTLQIEKEKVIKFWATACSREFRLTSMCFFSRELIELVNKTNSKLLYAELLTKATEQQAQQIQSKKVKEDANNKLAETEEDYSLLNAFEMLWNVDNEASDMFLSSPEKKMF